MVSHICPVQRKFTDLDTGKQWHAPKAAFRPKAGNQTYEKRDAERKAMAAVKAKEREMKEEKEAARKVCKNLFPTSQTNRRVYATVLA